MKANNLNIGGNVILTCVWFSLAALVVSVSVGALLGGAPLLSLPILALAYLIFMVGGQRVERFKLEDKVFNQRAMWIGIGVAVFMPSAALVGS